MPNQSGKILLVLILVLLTLGTAAYFLLSTRRQDQTVNYSPQPSTYPQKADTSGATKDYYSKNLKISFKVPDDAKTEEKFLNINISTPDGQIFITRNGTNYESVENYYSDLKKKNHLTPIEYKEGEISSYNYVLTLDEDPNNSTKIKKTYFIYSDYGIYIFSTSDGALYPVLDRIAESFEYKSNK